jgi:integrase
MTPGTWYVRLPGNTTSCRCGSIWVRSLEGSGWTHSPPLSSDSGWQDSPGRSRHHHRAVLHNALEVARKWQLIERNPVTDVDPPKVERYEARVLSIHEVRVLLESSAEDRLHALYVLALYTGLREAEMLGLQWSAVDLENGTLRVERQLQRRDGRFVLVPPKTGAGRREIRLPGPALAALRAHRARQVAERLARGVGGFRTAGPRQRRVEAMAPSLGYGRSAEGAAARRQA